MSKDILRLCSFFCLILRMVAFKTFFKILVFEIFVVCVYFLFDFEDVYLF